MSSTDVLAGALILLAALLYSAVGHGGASGYLAVMALVGTAPAAMKPAALALNVLVAGVAALRFVRAGYFSWPLFWPFAVTSVPAAYVGGVVTLPVRGYEWALGLVLVFSAGRMFVSAGWLRDEGRRMAPLALSLGLGALIGFVSGLIGVGGGIFLSPLLLLMGWAGARDTAGVSAVFILVNSLAGLLGYLSVFAALPAPLPLWAVAAVAGGWLGATYGSRRLPPPALRRLLALVLLVAAVKLIFL